MATIINTKRHTPQYNSGEARKRCRKHKAQKHRDQEQRDAMFWAWFPKGEMSTDSKSTFWFFFGHKKEHKKFKV
ncbi:hypothetical protein [Xanthomarina gelatinilytica]|uniref:hypothetical protein n=1 Tax=Xanthomarina gelatinilytica TaxID=1137281 RepID=UPI003AA83DD4